MDVDEWHRFVLDTERASYSTGDATGDISEWTSWSHSEIYRQVDFEYLDTDGTVIEKVEKVEIFHKTFFFQDVDQMIEQ